MFPLQYIQKNIHAGIVAAETLKIKGRVLQVLGTIIKVVAPNVALGEVCLLKNPGASRVVRAEVVGFTKDAALLTPLGELGGISSITEVYPTGKSHEVAVSESLLGRVLNGLGEPIDDQGPLPMEQYYAVDMVSPDPLQRKLISKPLETKVRVIDGFLTCGEGQRLGIFAAAGGGKSTLLGMLVKGADVDVVVLALIGERGREVREFIEMNLGPEGLKRSVLVVATSDKSSMERSKAAYVATSIAEYFRDQGKNVLFLMDSVTRYARAQREIGLAIGEPPARRGFPPSVFANLPRLMERTGMSDKGSITAFYAVLVEGDDMTEPIADETRSILDGHIILSRALGEKNHYPAIDVLASVSRVMNHIVTPEHMAKAGKLRSLLAKYKEIELLVRIGEYKKGSDPEADIAIEKITAINQLLCQGNNEFTPFEETLRLMNNLV